MAFIDRFIKVPISVYNIKDAEINGKADYKDGYTYLNPMEISEFYPWAEEEGEERPYIHVFNKTGRSFIVYLTEAQFIKLLNDYNK